MLTISSSWTTHDVQEVSFSLCWLVLQNPVSGPGGRLSMPEVSTNSSSMCNGAKYPEEINIMIRVYTSNLDGDDAVRV